MNKLRNNEISNILLDTMLERAYRLKIAITDEDSITATELSIWFNNLFECIELGNFEHQMLANANIAMVTMDDIKNKFPRFAFLYEEEQQVVLSLASMYKNETQIRNKALTRADCETWYSREITIITSGWFYGMASCSRFCVPWVVGACCVAETALALLLYHNADVKYENCLAVVGG